MPTVELQCEGYVENIQRTAPKFWCVSFRQIGKPKRYSVPIRVRYSETSPSEEQCQPTFGP